MTHDTLASAVGLPLVMAVVGMGFGLTYFAALRRTAALIATQSKWRVPVLLTLGRVSAAMILFAFASTLGAATLLAAFTGFLSARAVVLRSARRVG